jgi:RNA polymerase sigma-70 factor (ECF subfamily)
MNRAAEIAMRDGAAVGLALIEAIFSRCDLKDCHSARAARADLYRRLGNTRRASALYERAIALARHERRLADLSD